ncbi:hypothetical protein [Paracoccus cavernae]|uniref:hypothetical protein n=1 Tax=Paracoccus cavernae TaxID=1571207 RepID=UPI0035F24EC1
MFNFRNILGKGERLLWEGRPPTGIRLTKRDKLFVPFSIFWAGFAVLWNVGVWVADAPLLFRLWGLPFLVIAAYITVGRLWWDSRQRARTRYAVTNQRVMIATGMGSSVKSLDVKNLPALILDEDGKGSGTISFSHESQATGRPSFTAFVNGLPEFRDIDGARRVYEIIRKAQSTRSPFDEADQAFGSAAITPDEADWAGEATATSNIPRV